MPLPGIDIKLKEKIVHQLYLKKSLSCVDLSDALNKSIPLVTKAINELMVSEWIVEDGYAPSSGGRRPMMYALKHSHKYIMAISMDRLRTEIAIMDLNGQVVKDIKSFELVLSNNEDALATLIMQIDDSIASSGIPKSDFLGIGLAIPGFVNPELGISYIYMTNTGSLTLRQYLKSKIGIPVFMDNDSAVIALAEFRFGEAKHYKNSMVINIGWGIGLGMIINGAMFHGATGLAGELSHIPISDSDKLCDCGKRGCLETEASLLVVAQDAQEKLQNGGLAGLPYSESVYEMSDILMRLANKGNQDAISLFSEMGFKIGKSLSILTHIVNPEQIVLSGHGATIGKLLLAPIQQALNTYCIPRLFENLHLSISGFGERAQLIGAATMVMENINKINQSE